MLAKTNNKLTSEYIMDKHLLALEIRQLGLLHLRTCGPCHAIPVLMLCYDADGADIQLNAIHHTTRI